MLVAYQVSDCHYLRCHQCWLAYLVAAGERVSVLKGVTTLLTPKTLRTSLPSGGPFEPLQSVLGILQLEQRL